MRSRLFRKYAVLFAGVVAAALIANGLLDIFFSYRDQRRFLLQLQREQARFAAERIGQFVKDVEEQVAWTLNLRDYAMSREDRRIEALRLLRQAPAVTEIALIDSIGREQVKVSRLAPDVVGSELDRSDDNAFGATFGQKRYYGPVYFRYGSEPYMTLGVASNRDSVGVTVAEINLRFIWDILEQIRIGQNGRIYVTDSRGALIAHPDISLVLSQPNVSGVPHVRAAFADAIDQEGQGSIGLAGDKVIAASGRIPGPGWRVFIEMPVWEAYAPVYASLLRSGALLALAIGVALGIGFILARRMTGPIAALSEATARIGAGDLTHRVFVRTGDELEVLGNNVNVMAESLRESYSNLEQKVEDRTRQLAEAAAARSRFLAIASHDLRQPLHALGLFVGQLRRPGPDAKTALDKTESALTAMNELFDALLDISKLDSGIVQPAIVHFPACALFERLGATFEQQARRKGLSLRIVPTRLWLRSDPVLLERILINLVANAVRYAETGGVVVGCRRQGSNVRIEVHDSGPGIPPSELGNIFREFVRLNQPAQDSHGLGLGLAVVERLTKVLAHELAVNSIEGRGSCFSVSVPTAPPETGPLTPQVPAAYAFHGQTVIIIDDDAMTREGMRGLLEGWGCSVCTLGSWPDTAELGTLRAPPTLIISDYSLGNGTTGVDAIEALRMHYGISIPALLISGDTTGNAERDAGAGKLLLLRKPVSPMALRAVLIRTLARG
jgi:signal transduction histidine kinase/CheY-like chemotaxis protein